MFCNGIVILPDGRAFINGGTMQHGSNGYDPFEGQTLSAIYDPAAGQFTKVQSMLNGRWYPTVTNFGDGRLMTFSGLDQYSNTNLTVEIYDVNSGWSTPSPASPFTPGLYPRMHLLPNGQIFMSGPTPTSYFFNPSSFNPSSGWSSNGWSSSGISTVSGMNRVYGSSVLFPLSPPNYKPVVMILGGGLTGGSAGDATGVTTTEIIDLSAASPVWKSCGALPANGGNCTLPAAPGYGPPMSQARIEMNATILPNGKIIVLGGSSNDEEANSASLNADLYDPASNTFSSAGQSTTLCTGTTTNTQAPCYARLYHSNSLLLPDATVMLFGGNPVRGNYEPRIEIWTPPYLFNSNGTLATRPSVTSVPSGISYGAQFQVQTPNASSISSVVLMRPGAPTHAFDMEQRMVVLNFSAGSGGLNVTAPPNGYIAPPGYYLLFVLNSAGVPSVGQFVQLTAPAGNGNLVQSTSVDAGVTTSFPLAFPSGNTSGNWIGVVIRAGAPNETFTVSDTNRNVYQNAIQFNDADGDTGAIFYAENVAGGSNKVTVSDTTGATLRFAIVEFTGIAKSGSFDAAGQAQGYNANPVVGTSNPTTVNGDLLLGAIITADPETASAGGGYSILQSVPPQPGAKLIAEYQMQGTAGATTATAMLGTADNWGAAVAAFKPAGSGGGTNPPSITSVSPNSGPVGTAVTITGTNFGSGGTVQFNQTTATVTNWSQTSIATTVPAGATTGNVVVTVNGGGQSNGVQFTVTTAGGGGGINLVQHANQDAGVTTTSRPLAFPSNNTSGNWIGVCIRAGAAGETFTVTDSNGNNYHNAIQFNQTADGTTNAIFYAENIRGGSNTVSVSDSASGTLRFAILEFSGVAASGSLDVEGSAQGNNASPGSTATASTTANGDLLLGAIITGDPENFTAGPGYSIVESVPTQPGAAKLIAEYQVQGPEATPTASAMLGTADAWAAAIAAFKPAGSGGGGGASGPISIQFVGTGVPMVSSDVAGVVPVALSNWNPAQGFSNGSGMPLVNSSGALTTARVVWRADNIYAETSDGPGNTRMMEGYLDNSNCTPSSCGPQDTTTVTVSGLPVDAKGYTVYVYADGAQGVPGSSNTGIYQISGATPPSINLTYTSQFTGTFTQANNSVGNYVVFTIPNVSSFTLSAIPSTASSGYERAPLNGIQIIPN
jgi:hypothetical protein